MTRSRLESISIAGVGNWLIERQLRQTTAKLKRLRGDLVVIDAQLGHIAVESDDFGDSHTRAMTTNRAHIAGSIIDLEKRQDDLLDRIGK